MTMSRNAWLIVLAVVLFLLGLGFVVLDDQPDPEVIWGLMFAGSAAFAAGHLNTGP